MKPKDEVGLLVSDMGTGRKSYIYATIPVAAADWAQFSDNSFATVALDRVLPTGVGSADLYAVLVAGGSFSLASASDLTLSLTTEAL